MGSAPLELTSDANGYDCCRLFHLSYRQGYHRSTPKNKHAAVAMIITTPQRLFIVKSYINHKNKSPQYLMHLNFSRSFDLYLNHCQSYSNIIFIQSYSNRFYLNKDDNDRKKSKRLEKFKCFQQYWLLVSTSTGSYFCS